jgi:antitoxin CptB
MFITTLTWSDLMKAVAEQFGAACVRRNRLLFRCWHRGTQEGDLILGPFAEMFLAGFDSTQLDRFEALLDCTDPDVFDWLVVGITPPPEHDHDVMRMLRSFVQRDVGRVNAKAQTAATAIQEQ